MAHNYHTHIEPKNGWFDIDLKELWRYRDLVWLFTKKNFILIYKQTILGPAWIILQPLMTTLIYTLVFGGIAGISTDGAPQLLFYMGGTALWSFFSTCLTNTAGTFTRNAGVFGKVYFPRLVMPISTVLSSAINFTVQFGMFLLFWIFYVINGQVAPNFAGILLLPLILLYLGFLGLGCGIIISSLTTKYRDLSILVGFGIQLWMYATPIVYPISQIPVGWMRTVIQINPVTAPVELLRWAVLGQGSVDWVYYGISWVVTVLLALAGVLVFNRVEKTFMDTV